MNDHEERISALEDWQKQVNSNITALQELLNTQDYITKVSPLMENGVEIGYSIHFAKSDSIALYHGTKGADGADGYVPVISVKKDTDGIYYWTLDGDWLTDAEGHKIKAEGTDGKDGADGEDGKDGQDGEDGKDGHNGSNGHNGTDGRDGITPKLKIEEGTWYVSYDKGKTWEKLGVAIIEEGGESTSCTCPITDVDVQDEKVVFTLDSGDEFEVPYYEKSDELTITFAETTIELEAGGTAELTYELSYTENVKISAIGEGVRTEINDGKLIITATSENFEGGKVLVHATDGEKVAMEELTITKMMITYIEYTATEEITPSYDTFGGKGVRFLKDKSVFEDGKGKWAYKGVVTSVGAYAFYTYDELKTIVLPDALTSIGESAFSNSGLTSIKIPDGVTVLENNVFEACYDLTNVIFPSSLTKIEDYAFVNTSLSSVEIPDGVTTIGYQAFRKDDKDPSQVNPTFKTIKLPANLVSIEKQAFYGNSTLEEVTIPDKVTTIGEAAFSFCTSLKTVVLGASVKSIEKNAFNECKAIESITCKNPTPAELGTEVFPKDYSGFGEESYTYIIYVPKDSKSTYDKAWDWVKNKYSWMTDNITIVEQE